MVTLEYQKVLVPTDFSEQADQAVRDVLDAAASPADVTVIHVAPPVASYPVADPAIVWETVTEEARADRLAESFRQHISDSRAEKAKFVVKYGSPAEEIADYAAADHTELIVMPSHGRTGFNRLLLGSVTERVVRAAHCPVLVLRS